MQIISHPVAKSSGGLRQAVIAAQCWLRSFSLVAQSCKSLQPSFCRKMKKFSQETKGVFQSGMWKFDSLGASHPFPRSARFPKTRQSGPEIPAFRAFGFVSRCSVRRIWAGNRRKSPALSANIPVLRRLSAETRCDDDCRPTMPGVRSSLRHSRETHRG
jgi:hypothetical protein